MAHCSRGSPRCNARADARRRRAGRAWPCRRDRAPHRPDPREQFRCAVRRRIEAASGQQCVSSLNLPPHTDLPTRELQPGVQFLHCLANDATGGDSVFLDGFALAAARASGRFRTACGDAVRVLEQEREQRRCSAPVIADARGNVTEVRVANFLRGPLDAPAGSVAAVYRAYRRFLALARERALRAAPAAGGRHVGVRQPPRAACAHRVRSVYRAPAPAGCYIDRDELLSRWRVLSRSAPAGRVALTRARFRPARTHPSPMKHPDARRRRSPLPGGGGMRFIKRRPAGSSGYCFIARRAAPRGRIGLLAEEDRVASVRRCSRAPEWTAGAGCAVAAGVGTMNTRFGALDVVRVVRACHARLVAGLFELDQFVAHERGSRCFERMRQTKRTGRQRQRLRKRAIS